MAIQQHDHIRWEGEIPLGQPGLSFQINTDCWPWPAASDAAARGNQAETRTQLGHVVAVSHFSYRVAHQYQHLWAECGSNNSSGSSPYRSDLHSAWPRVLFVVIWRRQNSSLKFPLTYLPISHRAVWLSVKILSYIYSHFSPLLPSHPWKTKSRWRDSNWGKITLTIHPR